MYKERCNSINELIESKKKHDVGELYEYLNSKETEIVSSISGKQLIARYNLKSNMANRCVCPFDNNASNPTSFVFDDDKHRYHCYSCNADGTYINFIAHMLGYKDNILNDAKIFAANNFAYMALGFTSVSDFKKQLETLVLNRYKEINSLDLRDYYDISLLGNISILTKTKRTYEINDQVIDDLKIEDKKYKLHYFDIEKSIEEMKIKREDYTYLSAMNIAHKSKLIIDMTNEETNSRDILYDYMLKKYYISKDDCEKYGLVAYTCSKKSKLTYTDFFMINDRILFPFIDHDTGIVVGYQARRIKSDDLKAPKYLNISDYGAVEKKDNKEYRGLIQFSIGDFLFNLYNIKDLKIENLFITEGAADTIKLESLGYNSVSPGQANLTDHQIFLIYKYFGSDINIFLFFDNDQNNVGQIKSIINAYRLYQFGFKSINIVRTFGELGTDVTDVATKIQDDNKLKLLVDLWISLAYKFEPACNDDLNALYQSHLFTESELLSLDPINVKTVVSNVTYLNDIIDFSALDSVDKKQIKKVINLEREMVEFITKKSNNLLATKNDNIIKNVDENTDNITMANGNAFNEAQENNKNLNSWKPINLSQGQVYVLNKEYKIKTIQAIDEQCNKKQIGAIIGKIKNGIKFDIRDYLHDWSEIEKDTDDNSKNYEGFMIITDDDNLPF